jgi:hypothetical protein
MSMHKFSLHDEVFQCIVVRVGVIEIQIILKFIKTFEKGEFLIFLCLPGQILNWPTFFYFLFFSLGQSPPRPGPPLRTSSSSGPS